MFRKRTILVRLNHRELTTESNRTKLSIIRFLIESAMSQRPIKRQRGGGEVYLLAFLQEYLVVLTQGHTEDDRCDIFKAMDPFLSFTALATNIKHAMRGSVYGPQMIEGRSGVAHCILSWPMVNRVS